MQVPACFLNSLQNAIIVIHAHTLEAGGYFMNLSLEACFPCPHIFQIQELQNKWSR